MSPRNILTKRRRRATMASLAAISVIVLGSAALWANGWIQTQGCNYGPDDLAEAGYRSNSLVALSDPRRLDQGSSEGGLEHTYAHIYGDGSITALLLCAYDASLFDIAQLGLRWHASGSTQRPIGIMSAGIGPERWWLFYPTAPDSEPTDVDIVDLQHNAVVGTLEASQPDGRRTDTACGAAQMTGERVEALDCGIAVSIRSTVPLRNLPCSKALESPFVVVDDEGGEQYGSYLTWHRAEEGCVLKVVLISGWDRSVEFRAVSGFVDGRHVDLSFISGSYEAPDS